MWQLCAERSLLSHLILVTSVCYPLTSYPSTGSEVAFIEGWLECPMRLWVSLTHSSREEAVFPLCVCVCVCVIACGCLCVLSYWPSVTSPCNVLVQAVYMTCMCILSHLCWYVCFICVLHLSRSLWFLYPTAGLNLFTVSSTNLGTARCPRPSTEASVLPLLPCAKVHSPSLAGTNLVHHTLLS